MHETTDHLEIWDRLSIYGAPLGSLGDSEERPTSENLPQVIEDAIASLRQAPEQQDANRKDEALRHFLFAIRHYFPTRFARLREEVPGLDAWVPSEMTGRLIKHKRISARLMSRYL